MNALIFIGCRFDLFDDNIMMHHGVPGMKTNIPSTRSISPTFHVILFSLHIQNSTNCPSFKDQQRELGERTPRHSRGEGEGEGEGVICATHSLTRGSKDTPESLLLSRRGMWTHILAS